MSKEEKIRYLKSYRIQQTKINRIKELLEECPEKEIKYLEEIKRATSKRDSIENAIENIDGGLLSEVLFQKYILCKSMENIGRDINYSKRQIERLHLKAIEKLNLA